MTLRIAPFILLLAVASFAQPPLERPPRPFVRAAGEATVTANPDQARIDIGVVTQAATAQDAAAQNAARLDAVMADLRKAVGPGGDIKTAGYSLEPNLRYPREGGQPTIAGYTARNVVRVTLNDLRGVGKLIDAATRAGANTVQRVQFLLKDQQAAYAQALRDATGRARASAEAITAALGMKVVGVLSAEEGEAPVVRPVELAAMRAAVAAPPTPIEPGTIEVHATVTLRVEVGR